MNEVPHVAQLRQHRPRHIERISEITVPDRLSPVLDDYDETVGERDRFLWGWLYYLFPRIRLSCVPADRGDDVRDAKLLASMYVVLLDDLAEVERNEPTFQEAAKVPFQHRHPDTARPDVDARFVHLASRIWDRVTAIVEAAPRADEFRRQLLFDLDQNITAIEYSFLTNESLELATVEETTIYDSHNMMLFTYTDLDLLHSPAFDRTELGTLRKIVRRAQQMARIGNWVTTWERELGERDFSSGVVVSALENDVVTKAQLDRLSDGDGGDVRRDVARRIHEAGIEEEFLQQWTTYYEEIERLQTDVETVDVDSFLQGMETVLECHLASRGLK